MKHITDILSGIGILIAIYLVIANGNQTTKLINSIMSNTVNGIKVLQGRG